MNPREAARPSEIQSCINSSRSNTFEAYRIPSLTEGRTGRPGRCPRSSWRWRNPASPSTSTGSEWRGLRTPTRSSSGLRCRLALLLYVVEYASIRRGREGGLVYKAKAPKHRNKHLIGKRKNSDHAVKERHGVGCKGRIALFRRYSGPCVRIVGRRSQSFCFEQNASG